MAEKFQPPMNKWVPAQFPYGDFRPIESKYNGKTDYLISVQSGTQVYAWYCSEFVRDFLLHCAAQSNATTRDKDGNPALKKGLAYHIQKTENVGRGKDEPEYYWTVAVDAKTSFSSQDYARTRKAHPDGASPPQQGLPSPGSAPPAEEPPPPSDPNPPPVSAHEKDHAIANGLTPQGSAPPRISRSAQECIAILDMCVANAVRIAKKHKPHVSHVDLLACEMYTAMLIAGVRIEEARAKTIVEELKNLDG